MKERLIYIFILSGVISSVCACNRSEVGDVSTSKICISADVVETKGLLDQNTLAKSGNKIKVYDILQDISAISEKVYINDEAKYTNESGWNFYNQQGQIIDYYWTLTGTHRFFGWLSEDTGLSEGSRTPTDYFGDGFSFDSSSCELTIPEKAMTGNTPQFDFMYSNVVLRMMEKEMHSNVELSFNHLFSAFGIGVKNNMENSSITINDFKVFGLKNSSSAKINFGSDDPVIQYGTYKQNYGSDANKVFKRLNTTYTIAPKSKVADIFDGGATENYSLIWPQNKKDLSSTSEPEDIDGETVYPDDWLMYIRYTSDGKESEKKVNFPNLDWNAGEKYHFDIVFAEKHLDIEFRVSPWDYKEQTVDYFLGDTPTVSKDHRLEWRDDTCDLKEDNGNGFAYVRNGMPVKGRFQFDAPIGATWLATLTGDVDAFTLSPENGVIDGNVAEITLTPKLKATDISKDLKVQVKFAVRRTDGRTISADDIIQPSSDPNYVKYTVVLAAN